MHMRRLFNYFQRPFPAAVGFSPYRSPGLAVHLPILFTCLLLGGLLCFRHRYLWPLMLVYVVVGLYLGRDWAILAHYNPLIMIGAWLALVLILRYGWRIAEAISRSVVPSHAIALGVTAVVALLFTWHVRRTWDWCDDDAGKLEA